MTLRQSFLYSLICQSRPYRPFLIFLRCMLFITTAQGSHLAGSELTYKFIGSDRYEVIYVVYTDIPGSSPGNQAALEIKSASCNRYLSSILTLQVPRCEIINTNCASASAASLPAFKKWVYTGTAQLPEKCSDWKISVSDCCRSALITSISQPEQSAIYSEALINNFFEVSSPVFTRQPDFYLSAGQSQRLSQPVSDDFADSTVISAVAPSLSGTSTVNYLPGYSPELPIQLATPIQLDANTGEIVIQPSMNETGVMALRATGYKNGSICSIVQRETRVAALPVVNHLPEISGFDGTTNFATNACAGNDICFFLFGNDADQQDILRIEVLDSLPGASYSLNESGAPSLHCCWSPPVDSKNDYTFRIKITDNKCPLAGTQVYTYRIHVSAIAATITATPASCLGRADGSAFVATSGNQGAVACSWSPSGFTGTVVNNLPAGNHTVLISDESGCQLEKSITISSIEGFSVQLQSIQNATCSNSSDGLLEILLPEMTGRFQCEWLPSGSHSARAENLSAGNHQVTITDQQTGCIVIKNYSIAYNHQAPVVFLGNTTSACLGRSIVLNPGSGFAGYQWQDGSDSQEFSATITGYYSVRVTDYFGCQGESTIHLEFSTCTEVADPLAAEEIRIYPNPVQSTLRIDFVRPLKKETLLSITDVLGNRLMSINPEADAETASMKVENLPAGVYLLYIERASETAAYRFIKQ